MRQTWNRALRDAARAVAHTTRGGVGFIAALLLVGAGLVTTGCHGERALRVVYAGVPESAHMKAYEAFLKQYFKDVRTVPVAELASADLSDADVLVVEGTYKTPTPAGITLSTLSIPTVLVGGLGGKISDDIDLKLGWRYG